MYVLFMKNINILFLMYINFDFLFIFGKKEKFKILKQNFVMMFIVFWSGDDYDDLLQK